MPLYGRLPGKPILGTPIDYSAPMAAGLLCFWPLNEGAGPTAQGSTGRIDLAASGFGSGSPWGAGSLGPGLLADAAGESFTAPLTAAVQVGLPVTIAVAFKHLGAPTSNWTLMAWGNSTSSNIADIVITTTPGFQVFFGNGTGQSSLAAGFTFATGKDYVCIFSAQSGTQLLTANGATAISGTTAVSPAVYGTSPIVKVADNRTDRTGNVLVHWAGAWGRMFAASEHIAIGASPAAIFDRLYMRPGYRAFPGAPPRRVRRTLYDRAGSRGVA